MLCMCIIWEGLPCEFLCCPGPFWRPSSVEKTPQWKEVNDQMADSAVLFLYRKNRQNIILRFVCTGQFSSSALDECLWVVHMVNQRVCVGGCLYACEFTGLIRVNKQTGIVFTFIIRGSYRGYKCLVLKSLIFFSLKKKRKKHVNNVNRSMHVHNTRPSGAVNSHLTLFLYCPCFILLCSRGAVRVCLCVFPVSDHISVSTSCTAIRFWILLTHVYCHHQEVALLNLSIELNFSLQAKTSPWEQNNKKQHSFNIQEVCHFPWA